MHLTVEQEEAARLFVHGSNVAVSAVPGAGKSTVMIETCKRYTDGLSIILAYNHDLCEATKEKLETEKLSDRVLCYTFHGLCCACLAPAYDDMQLLDALDLADAGEIEPIQRLRIKGIFIDEAQDFKDSFLRLLNLVLVPDSRSTWMVVGDAKQMLYDYDDEDPAHTDYLERPDKFFTMSRRPWRFVQFTISHRLTVPFAMLVSQMFGSNVTSGSTRDAHPIVVRTINMWKSGNVLLELLRQFRLEDVVVLVEKRRGNGALRAAINQICQQGFRIFRPGIDGQDDRLKKGKVLVTSWHSSKGTEKKVTIVFGIRGDCKCNPSFVALTRSYGHLIIIQDESRVHPELCHALGHMDASHVHMDEATKRLTMEYADLETLGVNGNRNATTQQCVRAMDYWKPTGSGRWLRAHTRELAAVSDDRTTAGCARDDCDTYDPVVNTLGDSQEDVSRVYTLACLFAVEHERFGTIRFVEDMLTLKRVPFESRSTLLMQGCSDHMVSPNIPEAFLIPKDLMQLVRKTYESTPTRAEDFVLLACAAMSFNDYHHTMRQLLPLSWVDDAAFRYGCECVRSTISDDTNVEFDVVVWSLGAQSQSHEESLRESNEQSLRESNEQSLRESHERQSRDAAPSAHDAAPSAHDAAPSAASPLMYARCHAVGAKKNYHFIHDSEILPPHRADAVVRSAICSKPTVVCNIYDGSRVTIDAVDVHQMFKRIVGVEKI